MSLCTVSLAHLTKEFKLEMLYRSSDFEKIQITVEDVNRPALQLAGFFEHFEACPDAGDRLGGGHLSGGTDPGAAGCDL